MSHQGCQGKGILLTGSAEAGHLLTLCLSSNSETRTEKGEDEKTTENQINKEQPLPSYTGGKKKKQKPHGTAFRATCNAKGTIQHEDG